MMRRGLINLLLASGLLCMPAHARDLNLAVVVGLVRAPNPQANTGLQEWSQALQRHVSVVGYDVMTHYYAGQKIRIQPVELSQVPDPALMQSWWSQREAIYVLGAMAVSPSSSVTIIESTVYMGAFRGKLASPVFSVRQEVRTSNYLASQKGLEAITLYALGNQALLGGNRKIACALFRRASTAFAGVSVGAMQMQTLAQALAASQRDNQC